MDDDKIADSKRFVTAWIVDRYLGAAWPVEEDSVYKWRVISPEFSDLDIRFTHDALLRPESWLAEQLEAIAADASLGDGPRSRAYLVAARGLMFHGGQNRQQGPTRPGGISE